MTFCCLEFEKFRDQPNAPVVITDDMSVFYLGYHEVFRDDTPLNLKLKYCPFCGEELK
jgi:hypothetical protein